jgi:hypothetical protein
VNITHQLQQVRKKAFSTGHSHSLRYPFAAPESVNDVISDDFDHNPGIQFRQYRVFFLREGVGSTGSRLRGLFADSRIGVSAICSLTRWRCGKLDGPIIPVLKFEVHK